MEVFLPWSDPAGHSRSDIRHIKTSDRCLRCCTTGLPTDTTGLTVVLLLVPVKQVTHVTVVLPKLQMTLLTSLLHLEHQQTVMLLLQKLVLLLELCCTAKPAAE